MTNYAPLQKVDLLKSFDRTLADAQMDGFYMVCVKVFHQNSNRMKFARNFMDMYILMSEMMSLSLTHSICNVNVGFYGQILFIDLTETDGSSTNIDAEFMEGLSELIIIPIENGGPVK